MPSLIRILSIDGGGIRGIIPAKILLKLEQILQEQTGNSEVRISDYFDIIAGTSTGGILTCIYICPDRDKPDRPKFSAKDAVDFYTNFGPQVFKKPLWWKVISLLGLINAKYPAKYMEEWLKGRFGDLKLSQLLKPCLITAYNIEERYEHFFTSHDAIKNPDYNFFIRDVARATSAAPTFFSPARIKSMGINYFPLVDGGVFANNPALCAYTEVCKGFKDSNSFEMHPGAGDMVILSLGTGEDNKPIFYNKAKRWGILQWAAPITDVLMSGSPETVNIQLRTIYESIKKEEQYLRIDPVLSNENIAMDDVSSENISALLRKGEDTAIQYKSQLEDFARILIENSVEADEYSIA